MLGSLTEHVVFPPFRRLGDDRVRVDRRQQQQLVYVRRVVVPAGQIGGDSQRKVPQIVARPGAGVEQQQHLLERQHALLKEGGRLVRVVRRRRRVQIVKP